MTDVNSEMLTALKAILAVEGPEDEYGWHGALIDYISNDEIYLQSDKLKAAIKLCREAVAKAEEFA